MLFHWHSTGLKMRAPAFWFLRWQVHRVVIHLRPEHWLSQTHSRKLLSLLEIEPRRPPTVLSQDHCGPNNQTRKKSK